MLHLERSSQEVRILSAKGPDITDIQRKLNQWSNDYNLWVGQPAINDNSIALIVIRERRDKDAIRSAIPKYPLYDHG